MIYAFMFLGMESEYDPHISMLLFLLPLALKWWWDLNKINVQGKEPDHGARISITLIAMAAISWVVWRWGPSRFYIQALVFQLCFFAALFSYGLSILRGLNWMYIDKGLDGKRSFTDTVYGMLGKWKTLLLNIWLLFLGFSVYFYMNYIV